MHCIGFKFCLRIPALDEATVGRLYLDMCGALLVCLGVRVAGHVCAFFVAQVNVFTWACVVQVMSLSGRIWRRCVFTWAYMTQVMSFPGRIWRRSCLYLGVCGAGHVRPVDLNDLVAGLQAAVARHQALREHLLQYQQHHH